MATESPMRMVDNHGPVKWPSSKAAGDLGLHPNRSGSAPPSMEGSFASIGNLLAQQNPNLNPSFTNFSREIESCDSEEQMRADPAYLAYYISNVNLNPRLPPPLISRENRRLVRHVGGFGNNPRFTSLDESNNDSIDFSQGLLSTHKEESEDDRSVSQLSDDLMKSSGVPDNTTSSVGRHKTLVDLIQEDFPRTPSPVYTASFHSSQTTTEEPINININAMSLSDPSANVSSLHLQNIQATSNYPSSTSRLQYPDTQLVNDNIIMESIPRGNYASDFLFGNERLNQEIKHSYERNPRELMTNQVSQGMNNSYMGLDKDFVVYPTISSLDVHPPINPPGLTPPLYATAAAYVTSGNPYYPNLQPSGLFTPQYNRSGYAPNSAMYSPPYIAEYPFHSPIPVSFDTNPVHARAPRISAGETIPHGLVGQPPFMDPFHIQYLQHSFEGIYGNVGQFGQLTSRGIFGNQGNNFVSNGSSSVYLDDQNFSNIPSPRIGGVTNSYTGGGLNMGFMNQFPASPHASPVLPLSPVNTRNYPGRRDEMRFPRSSIEIPRHSLLEELKSNNSRKFELSDITGCIVEFSVDQHGSRFIQQKLEKCSDEEKGSVFREILPHTSKLMIDVFGNYVIQKFFEHGSPEQRRELTGQLAGHILPLSLQMYGCRVIQKALEVIELDQKTQLVHELDGNVMKCVRDQNGNHVIQKCIECIPTDKIEFIISAFQGQVATLSMHPYGCRVIQRILEHCSDEVQSQCIVDEILESACVLAQDQYGNYVTQHVLERGKANERSQIISKLSGKVVQMSQHKYASNVVEKCLVYGDASEREILIEEILGKSEDNDNLLTMMKDQFANFVIQKILDLSNGEQRETLLNRIKVHIQALKKYTYGKHIVSRFEQLAGEENDTHGNK